MGIGNVVDNLIKLEEDLSLLYEFFGKAFPEDAPFWTQLAEEEKNHAKLLIHYKKFLPIEFQKMDKKILIQTEEEIRSNLEEFKKSPPTVETASNLAYLLEKNAGESHYQALLEKNPTPETVQVFQTLNFADKDHAKRINRFFSNKRKNSESIPK
jgi:hypothetical protein